jgi:predicted aspartyl protease
MALFWPFGGSPLRAAILAAACFLGFCQPSLAADCAPPRLENTVKMERLGDQGVTVVPISLNGVEKKFLFDTGGGVVNYVSNAVAEELKLTQVSSGRSMDLRGNESDSSVLVKDVSFGTVHPGYVRFQVAQNLPYDGILSASQFAIWRLDMGSVDFDIDFGAMKLNFYSTDHCPGSVVYWPHQALAVVPVTSAQGHIEFPVTLDGHPLTAAIDTGASWTILNIARAQEKLGFSPDARAPQSPDIPKDDPDKQIYFRKYSALSFEGVTIANPLIIVRPVQFGGKDDPVLLVSRAQHASDRLNRLAPDIIIGMEILRHLHFYYATDEQKLYITPAGPG